MFTERGVDFDKNNVLLRRNENGEPEAPTAEKREDGVEDDGKPPDRATTVDELFRIRMEIVPQL